MALWGPALWETDPQDILTSVGKPLQSDEATIIRAYAQFYDLRGGGIETSFGQDKSGLGKTFRNKKRFEAARLLIWSRRWITRRSDPKVASRLQRYGMKRMVRDLYHISGKLSFDRKGRLYAIALEPSSSLAKLILAPLHKLLARSHIDVILDQT